MLKNYFIFFISAINLQVDSTEYLQHRICITELKIEFKLTKELLEIIILLNSSVVTCVNACASVYVSLCVCVMVCAYMCTCMYICVVVCAWAYM